MKEGYEYLICKDCGKKQFGDDLFMVNDELWDSAADNRYECLCIPCLEERIGRKLVEGDFYQYRETRVNLTRKG